MDIFNDEILKFWSVLNSYEVKYIMVGGIATNLHGFQRTTGDMDLYIEDSLENRKKLRAAFAVYGMGDFQSIETMQFVPGWTQFNLNNGFVLDIMTAMKGLENYTFDYCYQLASRAQIHEVTVPFLHINHLLANKKAVNRPKDQLDVIELERIQKLMEEGGV
jgi:hypothetical protein